MHLLLFISGKDWQEEYLREESKRLLKKNLGELLSRYSLEWYIHVNPPHKRTVAGLAHAHIFIRSVNSKEIADQVEQILQSGK